MYPITKATNEFQSATQRSHNWPVKLKLATQAFAQTRLLDPRKAGRQGHWPMTAVAQCSVWRGRRYQGARNVGRTDLSFSKRAGLMVRNEKLSLTFVRSSLFFSPHNNPLAHFLALIVSAPCHCPATSSIDTTITSFHPASFRRPQS